MNQACLREKLNFEHRILDGSADDAIRSIHQVRNVQQIMELHDYEVNHRPVSYTHLTLPTICSV